MQGGEQTPDSKDTFTPETRGGGKALLYHRVPRGALRSGPADRPHHTGATLPYPVVAARRNH